ncbi:TonB-dependent siderophore receptor [Nostoc sp. LEGE 12450]|uniref:TonB-dependent siderophore receptor n=1 Tax=Nostoc sp. LEGE 12450 TaxID=1828643 RepID=UPI001D15AA4E|nr:TonB-dependent siderophore receptor [Nostoc sp. LEGE 12450]
MKPEQFVPSLLFTVSVAVLMANHAQAEEIRQHSELWEKGDVSQIQQPPVLSQAGSQQVVAVTRVQVNSTAQGVEIILQTSLGEQLQVKPKNEGNTYIAEISNAQLRLSSGDTFRQEKPVAGIVEIIVNNQNANTILVTVKGEQSLPKVELFDSDEGLIFGLTTTATASVPATPPAQQPESETPVQPPSAESNEPIELVVTGDRNDDYNPLNATTGTRTDTPLRDTPQSIQVIPQKVIQDQQVVRLDEALRNISNVIPGGFDTNTETRYTIRGFDKAPLLINGFRQYSFAVVPDIAGLERIEVLKGPSSILYGEIQPGGVINAVTKQPLAEPFYEAEIQAGNYNLVRPRIDISGPLNDDKSVLYRLNLSYLNNESFRGFDQNFEEFFIAPVLAWKGKNTDFTFEAQYSNRVRPYDSGLVASGDRVLDVPRDRILNEPDDYIDQTFITTRYSLEHRFSDNWRIRNDFRYASSRLYSDALTITTGFDEATGIVSRVFALDNFYADDYSLQSNIVGKFATGGIKHTLLFGLDLNRTNSSTFAVSNFFTPSQLDVFNPVYGATPRNTLDVVLIDRKTTTDRLGVYLQDQIAFFENLKLLAGIRYETVSQNTTNRSSLFYPGGDVSQFDDAFTPRLGIVYQPLKEVSVYASYSQSFTPNIDTFDADGNPLRPERGEGYEVGVKTELLEGKVSATVAYFDITKQNVATTDSSLPGLGVSIATGEQRSRGVEFDISGQIIPGWNIIASYGYTDAEVTADNTIPVGNRLIGVPRHNASLWTTYEIQHGSLQGLGFGVGFNYLGEREGDLDNSFKLDDYFLTNAGISYRRDNWRFALNFKNIFDIDYISGVPFGRTSGIYPGEPFTVIGSVSVQF